jgi:PAS domain S-box-containing protein/putative nucleotidyltransferase with HDIG domain
MEFLSAPRTGRETPRPLPVDLCTFPLPSQQGVIPQKSNHDFAILIDNLPAVVFRGYIDGSMDFFDKKVEAMTGYPRKAFASRRKKWPDVILEADLVAAKGAFIKALKTNKVYVREYRIRKKNRQVIWLQERGTIVCDKRGKVHHIIGMLFDITQHKQAEAAIQEGQHFLSSIYTSIQDGITVLDFDLGIIQVNPTMRKWYAHAEPLIGKKCYEVYHGQEIPCRPCPAHRTLVTGNPHYEVVARKDLQGACSGWMEEYSFPWRSNGNGKIKGVIVYLRDITERVKTADAIEASMRKLKKTLNATVSALATTVETRDPFTAGHQGRVAQLACAIGQEMGVSPDLVEGLRIMGFLHDIGKIAVPAEILCKPGTLNEFEFQIIKTHPLMGYEILKEIEFPCQVAQVVLQHHERLNGSGYPAGLSTPDMLLEAKILAVADVTEAMASHRPYRPALGLGKAFEEISLNQGVLYDPDVVSACLSLFKEKDFAFR